MRVYVILDTDSLSRPWQYVGITMSRKEAKQFEKEGYTVKEYPLFALIRKKFMR